MPVTYRYEFDENSFVIKQNGEATQVRAFFVAEDGEDRGHVVVRAHLDPADPDTMTAYDDLDRATVEGWLEDYLAKQDVPPRHSDGAYEYLGLAENETPASLKDYYEKHLAASIAAAQAARANPPEPEPAVAEALPAALV